MPDVQIQITGDDDAAESGVKTPVVGTEGLNEETQKQPGRPRKDTESAARPADDMGDLEDFQGKAKKAPADAAMEKGGRDPEAGKAARGSREDDFGAAGAQTAETKRPREACLEEAEARGREAAVNVAPEKAVQPPQATPDSNAVRAEAARPQTRENVGRSKRPEALTAGEGVPEEVAARDFLKPGDEGLKLARRPGHTANPRSARAMETPRRAEDNTESARAESHRPRGEEARKQQAGRAQNLRGEITDDEAAANLARQAAATVADLQAQSTAQMVDGTLQTAHAIQAHTGAVLQGFATITAVLQKTQAQLEAHTAQIAELARSH